MRDKTKTALNAMLAEARRIKDEREGDPESVTVVELAECADMPRHSAYRYLQSMVKSGKAKQVKKRVGTRLAPSYRMV